MGDPLSKRSGSPSLVSPPKAGLANADSVLQTICLVGMIVVLVIFGLKDQWVAAGGAGICFVGALAVLRFSSMTKFSLSGSQGLVIENAVRAAHDAAEEAMATVTQLRALAATAGRLQLDNLALRNRLGVLAPRTVAASRDEVVTVLRTASCSDEDIAKAVKLLNDSLRYDLAMRVSSAAGEALMNACEKRHEDERYKAFVARIATSRGFLSAPSVAELRDAIVAFAVNDPGVTERLLDYERYERSGELPSYKGQEDYFDDPDEK